MVIDSIEARVSSDHSDQNMIHCQVIDEPESPAIISESSSVQSIQPEEVPMVATLSDGN